ncbi:EAL domain-containing protein [Sphingomonas sp. 1P06PA]|uniref:putative bifunctional diguanylate cyclase/phosphodiesterase n=1 Tax=Sphingomonas sp. 1P06PA TaxID=554121 RepID=UPI0039A4107E
MKAGSQILSPEPFDAGGASVREPAVEQRVSEVRQAYLDALPIAAAVVTFDGALEVADHNASFADLDHPQNRLIERPGLAGPLTRFLSSSDRTDEFDWRDGDHIGARHYFVRMARIERLNDAPRGLVSLVDRTAEIESQRSLRAETMHDSLTGLANRTAFAEAVERRMDAGSSFAVLVIDLNRFRRVNECMGGIVGDELIITVARRMMGALRGDDVLARLGGDEFAILLGTVQDSDAQVAAARVQTVMSAPFRLSEHEVRIDCSIGIATMNALVSVPDDMVRNAQVAMKRAKLSGEVETYKPGEVSAARRRFSLETELRRAIENDQLTLAWQPLIDLETGTIQSFEALARWRHPHRGAISPVEFIPVAEESGLILPLGRWAIDKALATLADWDARAGTLLPAVGVNISAIQLARDDVGRMIGNALQRHGIAGSRLTLEVTESAIIRDPARATAVLHSLKQLDASIAMDDFGTGYSSLAYLQKLPIDILKIDRSFVTPMLGDRDSVAIVRAVLSLAHALGMRTVAEGIETVELAQTLAALGCSAGQGYHYARPLDADAAFAYWAERA